MAQGNSYEEARKQRLEDNKRRFQELGVLKIASSLSDVIKTKRKYTLRSKTAPLDPDLMRRSSRPRSQVAYSEGTGRKNFETSYISTRVATKAERSDALKRAMRYHLLSRNPSFVKSMTFAHVSGGFHLHIPSEIINNHLPKDKKVRILLEDEEGSVYETNTHYGTRLNQWKTFSMNHKLDDGDALVMELIEPTRFKVHIFRVSNDISEVQVDELEQARESNSVQTVDAVHCRYISTRVATKEERKDALKRAISFQSGLLSGNPSFVKSMSRSQVSGCFTLDLPWEISNTHLPEESKLRIVLEDEEGSMYITHYNGRSKLGEGWRAFSRDHKLDHGDALVIELIEPTRFKVYIFKVSNDVSEVKVDEPKKARESKSSKTVDAEQICQKL
ncbi:hypothetical protein MKX03_030268 [Papaver bracteatum]|nr:hypothetical protein MKX03_030268 [Papaver bracteatum]